MMICGRIRHAANVQGLAGSWGRVHKDTIGLKSGEEVEGEDCWGGKIGIE